MWFLQSSILLAFPLVFFEAQKAAADKKAWRLLTASNEKKTPRQQSQALKAAVKLEKKKQDAEPSIRSSITECKFRQEEQRQEAAKKRAAKKAGPQAFYFFDKGLIFGAIAKWQPRQPEMVAYNTNQFYTWQITLKGKSLENIHYMYM